MKVTFKKRRYYKGKLREIGQTVEMDYKHAKAFIRVNAAAPAVTQAPAKGKETPKRTKPTEPATMTDQVDDRVKITDQTDLVVQEPEEEEAAENVGVDEVVPEFEELSYRELQEHCRARDLSASGSKLDLIKRLEEGE